MNFRFSLKLGFAILAANCGCAAADAPLVDAQKISFQFDSPTTFMSSEDMNRNGLQFPDGPMGFVRQDGKLLVIGAGGSFGGIGTADHLAVGSYSFEGTLDAIAPAKVAGGRPNHSLTNGREQPSPDGSDFDRDYAAGGPTYVLHLGGAREPPGHAGLVLLQIYHGEYHLFPGRGIPAYGGSGMAVSYDGGHRFEKIGQILSPHVDREEFTKNPVGGLWADGSMVEADANAYRDRIMFSRADHGGLARYYYAIFTDHDLPQERSGLSIARVREEDLLSAIRAHKAPAFQKYYNPAAKVAATGEFFTEPGIGGRSTPVLSEPGRYVGTPGVFYDPFLQRFILIYQMNQTQIILRTSDNLLHWSEPVVAFSLDAASNMRLFYPSLAGRGEDPELPDAAFYLYFVVRERRPAGGFQNPRLMRELVRVAR